MAVSELKDFLTCSVCLDTYTDPVSLSCHHSFCHSCLKDYWDKNQNKCCPLCRRKSSKDDLDINFSLRELSVSFKQKQKIQEQWMCSVHPAVPGLFCKDESRLLCPVCEFSQHSQHTVVSVDEAEMVLKKNLTLRIKALKDQRQSFEKHQETFERLKQHAKDQAESCAHQIKAVFQTLHRFLNEEQDKALAVLRGEHLKQTHSLNAALQSLKEKLFSLSSSIQELEQRMHTDTWTFLKTATQTHNDDLTVSSEPLQWPKAGVLNQARVLGNLGFRVWSKMKSVVHYSPVILDPNTAEEGLYLSEDLSAVRHGEMDYREVPDNPERFINSPTVLGSEGFSSGSHQWDVKVGDYKDWVIGIAKESVERKEKLYATPQYGIWCLKHKNGNYTNGCRTVVKVKRPPEKIRVKLDHDKGEVSFYDADHMTHLYTYTHTFTEKLFPFFSVGPAGDAKTRALQICETQSNEILEEILQKQQEKSRRKNRGHDSRRSEPSGPVPAFLRSPAVLSPALDMKPFLQFPLESPHPASLGLFHNFNTVSPFQSYLHSAVDLKNTAVAVEVAALREEREQLSEAGDRLDVCQSSSDT
ncbi:hypothetical protein WMY93_011191 [Mugilogobius chulae]|uniref:Uncharacterized protein n=1 Tax=Mugilogobius chulae TaxID=88201 RepID=A0AAW0P221_9GOBI